MMTTEERLIEAGRLILAAIPHLNRRCDGQSANELAAQMDEWIDELIEASEE